MFKTDRQRTGCFHVVGGGLDDLAQAPAIVVGEGYAPLSTLTRSLASRLSQRSTRATKAQVAQALHQKFPGKPTLIAGDDDPAPGTWHLAPGTWHLALGTWHPALA